MAVNDLVNKINLGVGIAGSAINAINSITGAGRNGASGPRNVQNLVSHLNGTGGIHEPNLFVLDIAPPRWAGGGAQPWSLIGSSVNVPGMNAITVDDRRFGYGTIDRKATGFTFSECTCTFFVSNDGQPLTYFTEWMNNIMYTDASKGMGARGSGGAAPGKLVYKENYETTISIRLLDKSMKNVIEYKLFEAHPMQVGDVQMEWATTDTFTTVAVNFAYRYYTVSKSPAPTVSPNGGGFMSQIKNGLGVVNRLLTSSPVRTGLDILNVIR